MFRNINQESSSQESFARELTEAILKGMNMNQGKIIDRYQLIDSEEYLKNDEKDKSNLGRIKCRIKEKLAKSFDTASNDLKGSVHLNSIIYDEIILLQSKFNRLNDLFQKGLIDFSIFDQEINKTSNSLVFIVNKLEATDIIENKE